MADAEGKNAWSGTYISPYLSFCGDVFIYERGQHHLFAQTEERFGIVCREGKAILTCIIGP